ncbi:MAG: hypothetical protein AMXMBFR4_21240 [Candidatus Hydrogenedentota bacterium]
MIKSGISPSLAFLLFAAVSAPFVTIAQMSADESIAGMSVDDGLEVTLFASEPDLFNPTSMDIDAQGRVWIAEAVNYRLFNQPKTREEGDRIRVLEDSDGDGRCDKATTFYQDETLQAPMGIAVLGFRVYVCQAPDLFYLQDIDEDGVADRRTVVLTGFAEVDNDHAIHGVMFGPDGLLYMSNGDRGLDVTDKAGNRIRAGKVGEGKGGRLAAVVLRTDLDGNRLEWLAEGMRNPYEPAVDPFGNVFISDNDDDGNQQCRINWVMEGGNYGYWPRRKGDRRHDEVHWNEDRPGVIPKMVKTGFGSPCGLMYYEGALLPELFRGALLHADAGPRVIRSYPVRPQGAGFASTINLVMSNERDPWCRPTDVCAAPDGSIFVCDWYDPGVGGHRMGDTARGRVYRIAPKGMKYSVPPLDLVSDDGLAAAFTSPNQARRYLAYTVLEERVKSGDTALLEALYDSDNPHHQARALWLLALHPSKGMEFVSAACSSADPSIRAQAIRIAARRGPEALQTVLELAGDPDPGVRRQLALELGRYIGEGWARTAFLEIAASYDGNDRFFREALGIALRGHEGWAWSELLARFGGTWNSRLANLAIQLHTPDVVPLANASFENSRLDVELRKLALNAIEAVGTLEAGALLAAVLSSNAPADLKGHVLKLLARDEGDAWRKATDNKEFETALRAALKDPSLRAFARNFVADTRHVALLPEMVAAALDPTATSDERIEVLASVQSLAPRARTADEKSAVPKLATLLLEPDEAVAAAAVKAIGGFRTDGAVSALRKVVVDNDRPLEFRREAIRAMSSTKSGSSLLLTMAERRELPQEFVLDATELLHASSHQDIRLMADKVLPRPVTSEGIQLPPLEELVAMNGDPVRGKAVFFSEQRAQCARCHMVNGEGKSVGPDLSVIGQKLSRQSLYESILNPSAAVAPEYKVWVLNTEEEGFLTGFIRSESPDSVELMDSNGTAVRIDPAQITERVPSQASLMPNGLSAALTAQELADIVAYLESLR